MQERGEKQEEKPHNRRSADVAGFSGLFQWRSAFAIYSTPDNATLLASSYLFTFYSPSLSRSDSYIKSTSGHHDDAVKSGACQRR